MPKPIEIFETPIGLTNFLIHSILKHLWLQVEHHCLSTVRWSIKQYQENTENPRNSRRMVKPSEGQATQLTLLKSSDSSSLLQLSLHPTMCCYIEETRVDLNCTNSLSFYQCWQYASTCQIQTLIWLQPRKKLTRSDLIYTVGSPCICQGAHTPLSLSLN